ncbi:MAG: CHAD domain-containing protein [Bacteroidota bacterium]|nr:CHAD domain-containing protein [Bacteroidota bacterium]
MKKMEPGHIIHYYFKRLDKYMEKMKKDFNEESIHLFRVEVKKLRAFLRMLRPGMEDPGLLKFPRPFKKMYAIAGKIRDRQLCLKRMNEYDQGNDNRSMDTIQGWEKEIEELTGKKDDFLSKGELAEVEEKIIKQVPVIVGDALLKNFFSQKLGAIRQVISGGRYRDAELHSIRKSIKDITYINGIFRDDFKTPLPFLRWNKSEVKKAEDLAHTLGLFNDSCIALSFLMPADIKKASTGKKKYLLSVRQKWLTEKRKLKKEILKELPAINLNIF